MGLMRVYGILKSRLEVISREIFRLCTILSDSHKYDKRSKNANDQNFQPSGTKLEYYASKAGQDNINYRSMQE